MKLKKYLTEAIKVEQYLSHIKKKCPQAVRLMTSTQRSMFRGLDVYTELVRKKVRQDRKPKDSWEEYSEYLDNELQQKFGWKPRQEGLFVTSKYQTASSYGHVYVIFPVGKFKYVWNKNEIDNLKILGSRKGHSPKENPGLVEPRIERAVDKDFTDKNIEEAMRMGNEIMIQCKEYFGINQYWIENNKEIVKEEFGQYFPTEAF